MQADWDEIGTLEVTQTLNGIFRDANFYRVIRFSCHQVDAVKALLPDELLKSVRTPQNACPQMKTPTGHSRRRTNPSVTRY